MYGMYIHDIHDAPVPISFAEFKLTILLIAIEKIRLTQSQSPAICTQLD